MTPRTGWPRVTDPLGHTTIYGYDTVDNQTSVTDPLGHATTYTYDALNRRTSVKDALNHTTSYVYDANGNRTKVTDANNKVTQYTYDEFNRSDSGDRCRERRGAYAYDAAGNRIGLIDANNHATTYAYDELNRLISATDPLSHVTSYGYDAAGNRTSQTKPDGTAITYVYDDLNRLTAITYPGGSVGYAYDEVGNRTTMTDATGVTTYTYDDLDRLTQVAGPTARWATATISSTTGPPSPTPAAQTVSYAYDLAGRLTTVTDYAIARHHVRLRRRQSPDRHRLSQRGPGRLHLRQCRPTAERCPHPSTNGTIASASYTLDNVGNRLTMVDPDGTTTYTYDNLYRLTKVTYPNGEQVTYAYDPMGNRTSMTSSLHGTTSYTYDAADRLLRDRAGGTTHLGRQRPHDRQGRSDLHLRPARPPDAGRRRRHPVQFAYNGDGVRLSKTVNGATTTYLQDLQAALPCTQRDHRGQTSLYLYGNDLLAQLVPPATQPINTPTDWDRFGHEPMTWDRPSPP